LTTRRLSALELKIMNVLWERGPSSVREVQEAFPEADRPAYTTIQTTIGRMEAKGAVRRAKKISNAHIFEAVVSRTAAHRRIVDDLLGMFGGRVQPLMSHLVETDRLSVDDLREAERALRGRKAKERKR
jgi:predicted transcriptional regulator